MQSEIIQHYDYRLVVLSILVAICSAYSALDLTRQVFKTRGFMKIAWLAGGSIALGTGIWAMHYIGMDALSMSSSVRYDWPTTLLSFFAAVGASAVALYEVGRPARNIKSTALASVCMGAGICAMHYIGMASMRMHAAQQYSIGRVIVSILIAIALSYGALEIASRSRENSSHISWLKLGFAILMGLAISAMHYAGMAAVSFHSIPADNGSMNHTIGIDALSVGDVCSIVLLTLLLVFVLSTVARQHDHYQGALADQRANLQVIFDSLREGVLVVDRKGNIVHKNRAAIDLLRLPDRPMTHPEMSDLFEIFLPTGELVPPEAKPVALAWRGEFLHNCELRIRLKGTDQFIVADLSTAPVQDRHGRVEQIVVTYRDITQPKEIDEARIRLASIVDSSEDAIIGKDLNSIVHSWNRGAEKIFGYKAEEMIGQSVRRLIPDDRMSEEDDILAKIQRGEEVEHIETVRKKKNGQFIHVSLMISPIHDSQGRVVGASKIARNITDRKQLESQLLQSQKMEAIGQLTGGIAHDFNNLLAITIGNLELLERRVQSDEIALKRLTGARNAALRGADLTRRLLAFSRQQALEPQPTDLRHAIRNVLELASPALGPEISVITQLAATSPLVNTDQPGLESALLNLFVNARDAMPRGGKLTITCDAVNITETQFPGKSAELQPGRYACISISDTGHGMPPETIKKALEPFFTTKPKGKGTGLGLSMVYGFFKQSGGTVRLYSEVGYGTTVSVYLPILNDTSIPQSSPQVDDVMSSMDATILIVDDEAELLEIISSYLEEAGYTVFLAHDGESARLALAEHPEIDLLLTDIIMPGGTNGADLAKHARLMNPQIRIIYCSGFSADALAEKTVPIADAPLLRKPYQRSELLRLVRQSLLRLPGYEASLSPVSEVS